MRLSKVRVADNVMGLESMKCLFVEVAMERKMEAAIEIVIGVPLRVERV